MNARSPFTDPIAVEAWDARFRWRRDGRLQDLTVEATWHRVAAAIAAAEAARSAEWARRFADAFADWRLLPDESLLRTMGTDAPSPPSTARAPGAVLNAAAFVRAPLTPQARFDATAFARTAGLAVRLLDDALLMQGRRGGGLRIGVIGFADALHLLNLRYDGEPARELSAIAAHALNEGALAATIGLAAERGATAADDRTLLHRCLRRSVHSQLIGELRVHGVRHADLTAIDAHPWLALFANNLADALDPLAGPDHAYLLDLPDGERLVRSSGAALTLAQRNAGDGQGAVLDTAADVSVRAQLQLRAAWQPWIDAPIDCPVAVAGSSLLPGERTQAERLAQELGLPAPRWRALDREQTTVPHTQDDPIAGEAAAAANVR